VDRVGQARTAGVRHPDSDPRGPFAERLDQVAHPCDRGRRERQQLTSHGIQFLMPSLMNVVGPAAKASARLQADRTSAAVALRRVRAYSRAQTSTKWSTSAAVLAQPKLIRIALAASAGGTPMAASTWDGPTLPEEQAEPVLIAMPA